MKNTGTPIGVLKWVGALALAEDSAFALVALDVAGDQLVSDLDAAELRSDAEGWANRVCELATEDAEARGQTTRYQVRHYRSDATRGVYNMRRVINDASDGAASIDASANGIIAQLLKSQRETNAQMIEMFRASTEAQKAAGAMVGAMFQQMKNLQEANTAIHLDALTAQEDAKAKGGSESSDPFTILLKEIAPTVGPELVKRMFGALPAGDAPAPAAAPKQIEAPKGGG